ncbi:unnamed protein product [Amoebophrya sp. A25]|nr:unnamed protein product [Amoebophrya sp. A25]|eukprot:GSA25T00015849001.1
MEEPTSAGVAISAPMRTKIRKITNEDIDSGLYVPLRVHEASVESSIYVPNPANRVGVCLTVNLHEEFVATEAEMSKIKKEEEQEVGTQVAKESRGTSNNNKSKKKAKDAEEDEEQANGSTTKQSHTKAAVKAKIWEGASVASSAKATRGNMTDGECHFFKPDKEKKTTASAKAGSSSSTNAPTTSTSVPASSAGEKRDASAFTCAGSSPNSRGTPDHSSTAAAISTSAKTTLLSGAAVARLPPIPEEDEEAPSENNGKAAVDNFPEELNDTAQNRAAAPGRQQLRKAGSRRKSLPRIPLFALSCDDHRYFMIPDPECKLFRRYRKAVKTAGKELFMLLKRKDLGLQKATARFGQAEAAAMLRAWGARNSFITENFDDQGPSSRTSPEDEKETQDKYKEHTQPYISAMCVLGLTSNEKQGYVQTLRRTDLQWIKPPASSTATAAEGTAGAVGSSSSSSSCSAAKDTNSKKRARPVYAQKPVGPSDDESDCASDAAIVDNMLGINEDSASE